MSRICAFLIAITLMGGCGLGAWAQERLQRVSGNDSAARITKVAKRHKRYKQGKHPSGHKHGRHKANHPQGHRS